MASGDAKAIPQKNVALRITFPIFDADGDLVTGAAGLDSEVSKDGGAFADCTNEATEIATSSGMYYLDLTNTEMNADTVAVIVKTSTSGAKTTPIVLYTAARSINDLAYPTTSGRSIDVDADGGVEVDSFQTGAITAAAFAAGAIDAAAIATDAIGAAEIADGAITAATFAANAIDATAIAANAIDDAALAADMDTYQMRVFLIDDDGGSVDLYLVVFFKNGQPITAGITSPTIQVVKASDGSDLIAADSLTQIAATGYYKYSEGTDRIVEGDGYIAVVTATIDSSSRTWAWPIGRDD